MWRESGQECGGILRGVACVLTLELGRRGRAVTGAQRSERGRAGAGRVTRGGMERVEDGAQAVAEPGHSLTGALFAAQAKALPLEVGPDGRNRLWQCRFKGDSRRREGEFCRRKRWCDCAGKRAVEDVAAAARMLQSKEWMAAIVQRQNA